MTRKLRDLDAVFVQRDNDDSLFYLDTAKGAQGIQFHCPCDAGHDLLLWFANPLDAEVVPIHVTPMARWQRIGDSLDSLTLAPSVNAYCWHGFVKDGLIL